MQSLRATMFVGCGAAAVVLCVVIKKEMVRQYASSLCERRSERPVIATDLVRDGFTTLSVEPVLPTPGHTHASAAGLRTSATNFVKNLAIYCGSEVYVIGMSKSDQRKGMKGSRQWWWAKDVNADNRNDVPDAADIRYLCDVDYYVDMPMLLAEEAKPVVLYSVVPEEAVCTSVDDSSFRFDETGALTTVVAGAGTYHHFLWDYGSDSLLAVKTLFGVPYRVISYAVERKQVGPHRQLVLLSPIRIFKYISAILAVYLLESKPLTRFTPVVKAGTEKFIRFNVHGPKGTFVTTARPDTWLCATVEASLDASIATVARLGTTNLMMPTTASWLANDRPAAAVLTEFHRLNGARSSMTVYPVAKSVRAYQFKPKEYDQEARPKLEAFMSPIVHEAYSPVFNRAGEEQSVNGRINNLKKPEPRTSAFVDKCMDEFAILVLQGATLEPVCYETVSDKQRSAAQQLSLRKAVLNGPYISRILKCFGKAEAYSGCKDGRNISTYNDADKLEMSMFALALSEHCKQHAWYGPGKTPVQVAHRVAEICENAVDNVNISDFHRMDGTISYYLRNVDRAVCMKAFTNHRASMNELLKRNVDNVGVLPLGTRFKQGPSHGSGCSATSVFQTLRAAFTAYLGFRHQVFANGARYTSQQAFDALGIHLGDDGLDADLPESCHKWAAERVGLILEAAMVPRGFRGVNFLARYYSPEVWNGSLNSMCDVKRQLSKFHTTVRLPANVTPEQKLVEKCMSYVATDGNTPVIGEYCKRVLLLSSYRPKTLLGIGSWWSKFEISAQYPNENVGGWMDVEFTTQFEQFDRTQFNGWLDSANKIQVMLCAPLCAEPEAAKPVSVDVVVDGDVLEASPPATASKVTEAPPVKTERANKPKSKRQPRKRNTGPEKGKDKSQDPRSEARQ